LVDISSFIDRWRQSGASERANKDSFLRDLCDVLGVPHPDPATGDPERDRYVFERDAVLIGAGEKHTIGKIDLYKHGCFILEAKQGSEAESKKLGSARRGTPSWNMAMIDAYGKAVQYASTTDPPPPFLIVTDIGECFDLYACFDGSRRYLKFPDALSSRIHITRLAEPQTLETLRAIFIDPLSLDPSKRATRVTREIATHLANLARSLEEAGHAPELVAKFLMRCLFTMFAEDVELLPKGIFADALRNRWIENPDAFPGEVSDLWRRMNEGGYLFGAGNIWKFNGGLFAEPAALPLNHNQLYVLGQAAASNWADVEPAIFGTLLERALDPKERHRLGAHYTPRAYVERLVRPTIEEPLRAEWDNVRVQVINLFSGADAEANRKVAAEARKIVNAFYDRLRSTRVLDPACGSGNFLFVALDLFKRIENEVIDLLDSLGDDRAITTYGRMITPEQFLGIEIKPWAKEITELVLWIGWLQWQIRTRGYKSHPQEPILHDYHNIECRDAVLAYDAKEPLLDGDGKPVTRWDGVTMKVSPVTGEAIPDDAARMPVYQYSNPRKAEWPEAAFIVGNPPFIGNKKMRTALGDGYVDALRSAHDDVTDTADFVMYWWSMAARAVSDGRARRFGLITTNSITQTASNALVRDRMERAPGVSLVFAVPDHPWSDSESGAAVRIAITVGSAAHGPGTLMRLAREQDSGQDEPTVEFSSQSGVINADLTIGADVNKSLRLRSNADISFMGVTLVGDGFRVAPEQAAQLRGSTETGPDFIKPYVIGRDLTQVLEQRLVIDLYGQSLDQVRDRHPAAYQWLSDRVRPGREQNKRESYRKKWWLFGEPRAAMRTALRGMRRYIATPETSKHRVFIFLEASTVPDHTAFAIALDDAFGFGALCSRVHSEWASAAGSRMGVGNDLRWRNVTCFEPFPFPDPDEPTKQRIRDLGEQLDAHRKRQQALHPELTITGMYNVLEKLRSGEELTAKDKVIHEQGLVSVLKQIHDDLDAAVFDAYGWPHELTDEQILERLVALNAERAEEERKGLVRWLRPEFQNPAGKAVQEQHAIGLELEVAEGVEAAPAAPVVWPKELPQQIAAVRDLVTTTASAKSWTAQTAAGVFRGARRKDVEPILDSLAALGLLIAFDAPDGRHWRAA
jgi:hypothetical protein